MSKMDICIRSARLQHQGGDTFQNAKRDSEIVEVAEKFYGDIAMLVDRDKMKELVGVLSEFC